MYELYTFAQRALCAIFEDISRESRTAATVLRSHDSDPSLRKAYTQIDKGQTPRAACKRGARRQQTPHRDIIPFRVPWWTFPADPSQMVTSVRCRRERSATSRTLPSPTLLRRLLLAARCRTQTTSGSMGLSSVASSASASASSTWVLASAAPASASSSFARASSPPSMSATTRPANAPGLVSS